MCLRIPCIKMKANLSKAQSWNVCIFHFRQNAAINSGHHFPHFGGAWGNFMRNYKDYRDGEEREEHSNRRRRRHIPWLSPWQRFGAYKNNSWNMLNTLAANYKARKE